jgi:Uncharacterised protein family (UPF0175)
VVRMAAATKLFELGKLSSGAAARLAGVPRAVFLTRLATYGVDTFRLTEEDFRKETRLGCGRLRHLSSSPPAPERRCSKSKSDTS